MRTAPQAMPAPHHVNVQRAVRDGVSAIDLLNALSGHVEVLVWEGSRSGGWWAGVGVGRYPSVNDKPAHWVGEWGSRGAQTKPLGFPWVQLKGVSLTRSASMGLLLLEMFLRQRRQGGRAQVQRVERVCVRDVGG